MDELPKALGDPAQQEKTQMPTISPIEMLHLLIPGGSQHSRQHVNQTFPNHIMKAFKVQS